MVERDVVVRLAEKFRVVEGRFPSRLDWRGENHLFFCEKHGLDYPTERQVQRIFGSWGGLLVALGLPPKRTQETADIAVQHVLGRYGADSVEIMPGRSGTIDCFVEGERTEIKGATIRKDDVIRTPRWRFRLHGREYSMLVDRLILVGLVNNEPVIEWSLDNVGMHLETDGRDTLNVPAKYPFKNLHYGLFMYETWKANYTYEELLDLAELLDA